jgi:hypothetical protein
MGKDEGRVGVGIVHLANTVMGEMLEKGRLQGQPSLT